MGLTVDYSRDSNGTPVVTFSRKSAADSGAWSSLAQRFANAVVGRSGTLLRIRADAVASDLAVLRNVVRDHGVLLDFTDSFRRYTEELRSERNALDNRHTQKVSTEEVAELLKRQGFVRELRDFQLLNVARLAALPAGADFSVPGAGKTTVSLALTTLLRARDVVDRTLIVAPIAAFASWQEELAACFTHPPRVQVHGGTRSKLLPGIRFLLTNYHRLADDLESIRSWAAAGNCHLVLDEAHRIKRGRDGVHGAAALDLSLHVTRRDVLTGTPAPNGPRDVAAVFGFLYPTQWKRVVGEVSKTYVEANGAVELEALRKRLDGLYVRSTKRDLGIPDAESPSVVTRPMGEIQQAIYSALAGTYVGRFTSDARTQRHLRQLGHVTMYLLEAATNPSLLPVGPDIDDDSATQRASSNEGIPPALARLAADYSSVETPWKYELVRQIAAETKQSGEKVIIWSGFVRNLKLLESFLSDFQPAVVHGGIPPRDGAPETAPRVREDELDRFRYSDSCSVLLANPAACGEGVSLHHWCHHAVYLDRNFNAGEFLQSQDRIHRLGLPPGTRTRFTVLQSAGTIDHVVGARLAKKVVGLASLLNDGGLVTMALPDAESNEALESSVFGLDVHDAEALVNHLQRTVDA